MNAAGDQSINNKRKKTRSGCWTCRRRRQKCDERKPTCLKCNQSGIECEGYDKKIVWRPLNEGKVANKIQQRVEAAKLKRALRDTSDRPLDPSLASQSAIDRSAHLFREPRTDIFDHPQPNSPTGPKQEPSRQDLKGYREQKLLPPSSVPLSPHAKSLSDNSSPSPSLPDVDLEAMDILGLGTVPQNANLQRHTNEISKIAKFNKMDYLSFPVSSLTDIISRANTASPDPLLPMPPVVKTNNDINKIVDLDSFDEEEQQRQSDDDLLQNLGIDTSLIPLNGNAMHLGGNGSLDIGNGVLDGGLDPLFLMSQLQVPPELTMDQERTFRMMSTHTCRVMSLKDGVLENPWREEILPLSLEQPVLYESIAALTKIHAGQYRADIFAEGQIHLKKALALLISELTNKTIRPDTLIVSTIALANAEAWSSKATNGLAHIRGALSSLIQLIGDRFDTLPPWLQFLLNSWLYFDVIGKITAKEDSEHPDIIEEESSSSSFSNTPSLNAIPATHPQLPKQLVLRKNHFSDQGVSVDNMLGAAQTLFPLLSRVSSLAHRVAKMAKNTPAVVATGAELQRQLLSWQSNVSTNVHITDPTVNVNHVRATAESYRWATLLWLHQAVPEIPSETSHELAFKCMMELASIHKNSGTYTVHMFPLLMSTCLAEGEEERTWAVQEWETKSARLLINNVDNLFQLVKEVWRRRDLWRVERQSKGLPIDEEHEVVHTGVRGRIHWLNIMREWKWELLVG